MMAIIKKELGSYFCSVIGFVFTGLFVLVTAIYFSLINVFNLLPDYSYTISTSIILLLVLIPALTMRSFAEEAKQKTDQLLFTSPITINEIVFGKFFASSLLFLLTLGITALFPCMLSFYGTVPAYKVIGAFIGYGLVGITFISVGIFISSLTDNQIVASIITFCALFALFMIDSFAKALPVSRDVSAAFVFVVVMVLSLLLSLNTKNYYAGVIFVALGALVIGITYFTKPEFYDGLLVKVFNQLSVMSRFDNFLKGILNLSDVVFYLSFSVAFIFFTINVIEKKRWS